MYVDVEEAIEHDGMVFVWAGDEGEEVPGEDDPRYPDEFVMSGRRV